MYKSITIKNLRAITELHVDDLARVNLFVGQNGCGKTTLLEGIFLLIGGTNPNLPVNANLFRGLNVVSNTLWQTYFRNMDSSVPIEISGMVTNASAYDNLVIRGHPIKSTIAREELMPSSMIPHISTGSETGAVSTLVAPTGSETGARLDGLELEFKSSGDGGGKTLSTIVFNGKGITTDGMVPPSVRGVFIGPLALAEWENRFGEIQRKKRVHEVVLLLKQTEPLLSDLRLNPQGMLMADIGLAELIPVKLMGGGISKLLTVALNMIEFQDGVVLIDEIESGLHYSAQQKLWEAIFSWADKLNVQVFATTHSRESIAAFCHCADATLLERGAKLFRIEREGEKFAAVEYTKELLGESLRSNWEVR